MAKALVAWVFKKQINGPFTFSTHLARKRGTLPNSVSAFIMLFFPWYTSDVRLSLWRRFLCEISTCFVSLRFRLASPSHSVFGYSTFYLSSDLCGWQQLFDKYGHCHTSRFSTAHLSSFFLLTMECIAWDCFWAKTDSTQDHCHWVANSWRNFLQHSPLERQITVIGEWVVSWEKMFPPLVCTTQRIELSSEGHRQVKTIVAFSFLSDLSFFLLGPQTRPGRILRAVWF